MPFRPTHRQLEYLVALDETRHFGRAAQLCHVSQPTLSVQISLLEKQLDVVLVERTPGAISLSSVGQDIAAAARSVLATLDDIVTVASAGRDNLGSLIRLGVVPTFGPYFLPVFLPDLHRRYPALRVHVREERPALLEDQVRGGDIDCALGQQPKHRDSFVFEPICREQILLGIPVNHRLASAASVRLTDLEGETLLTLGRGHRLVENVRELATLSGSVMAEDYEGTSLDALRQMVAIEMGLSLFPEFYVRTEFAKEANVKLFPIEDWPASREMGFFWRSSSARGAHFRQLAVLAREILGQREQAARPPA
ncbi:hydrogen peroxide-inducible genes activator [Rhizobium sp. SL86]|uniref:hydrogen peroxide-inducible genes activator n=1 Tax=Rhizobium sp. SL86 TaxID=2995148 RepID=UPI002274B7D2|nr:hydrogen peroxide-inducible genes activator [Rhizobium sp. SL86]MCY1665494.1 hydrogen peroxide-inducible genes activator [Rhizobium sp. SL86]